MSQDSAPAPRFVGWGTLTRFRQHSGQVEHLLRDIASPPAMEKGRQMVLGTLGDLDLACLNLSERATGLDTVPFSPCLSSRSYTGLWWEPLAGLWEAIRGGYAETGPMPPPSQPPDWLVGLDTFTSGHDIRIGATPSDPEVRPLSRRGVLAFSQVTLRPEITIAHLPGQSRWDRLSRVLGMLLSAVAKTTPGASDLRLAVAMAADELDYLVFIEGRSLEEVGRTIGALRSATASLDQLDLARAEEAALDRTGAIRREARAGSIALARSVVTTVGLRIHPEWDDGSSRQVGRRSRTTDPGWEFQLVEPEFPEGAEAGVEISTDHTFEYGDGFNFDHPGCHIDVLFGPHQVRMRRDLSNGLTGRQFRQIVQQGIQLRSEPDRPLTSISSRTHVSLTHIEPSDDPRLGHRDLARWLVGLRDRHLLRRDDKGDPGLLDRWLTASRRAELPLGLVGCGERLIKVFLLDLVGAPERLAPAAPLFCMLVKLSEQLAHERVTVHGALRRTARSARLTRELTAVVDAATVFLAANGVRLGVPRQMESKESHRVGRTGDGLLALAVRATVQGLWPAHSRLDTPHVLVVPGRRGRVRCDLVAERIVRARAPDGDRRLTVASWDVLAATVEAAIDAIQFSWAKWRPGDGPAERPALDQTVVGIWSRLAHQTGSEGTLPAGHHSVGDLLQQVARWLRRHHPRSDLAAATARFIRTLVVGRCVARLLQTAAKSSGDPPPPWSVVGPHLVRRLSAALTDPHDEGEVSVGLIVLTVLLSCPDRQWLMENGVPAAVLYVDAQKVLSTIVWKEEWWDPRYAHLRIPDDDGLRPIFERIRSLLEDLELGGQDLREAATRLRHELKERIVEVPKDTTKAERDRIEVDPLMRLVWDLLGLADALAAACPWSNGPAHGEAVRAVVWGELQQMTCGGSHPEARCIDDAPSNRYGNGGHTWPPFLSDAMIQTVRRTGAQGGDAPFHPDDPRASTILNVVAARAKTRGTGWRCYRRTGGIAVLHGPKVPASTGALDPSSGESDPGRALLSLGNLGSVGAVERLEQLVSTRSSLH